MKKLKRPFSLAALVLVALLASACDDLLIGDDSDSDSDSGNSNGSASQQAGG